MNKNEPNFSMVGGIIAATGAGVCCVGPLLLLLLGISGSWISNLTAFEPYRPLFIIIVVLLLGFAGCKIYRPIEECESENACANPKTRHRRKVIFWLITAAAAIVLVTSNYWILWLV